jgi:hypothetical protein
MLDNVKDLFGSAKGPGDYATILVFGTAGLVVDAGLNAVGFLSPGAVGASSASLALGVRKGLQQRKATKRKIRAAELAAERVAGARARAESLEAFFEQRGYRPGIEILSAELELHEQGIIDDARLYESVEEALNAFRDSVTNPPAAVAAPVAQGP